MVKNIKATNYRDWYILWALSLSVGASPIHGNNLIDNCVCIGNSTANNGIIYTNMRDSGITNCIVKDLKIDGTLHTASN